MTTGDGARRVTTGDELRARAPHVQAVYDETRRTVLDDGIVESELKELCARHLAEDPAASASDERQRAALAWADAIAYDSDAADDALWDRLHAQFTEPELVELGYSIAIALSQQHWLATHGVVEPRTT